jgi:predicted CoA-binding protein
MKSDYSKFFDNKKVALAGISRNPGKFGNAVFKELRQKGFEVYPLHKEIDTFEGVQCYRRVGEIPAEVESLIIAVRPDEAAKIVEDTRNSPIKRIWFQQGSNFTKVVETARGMGRETFSKKCVLMYAPQATSIHKFHQFLAKMFGRY